MQYRLSQLNIVWTVLLSILAALSLNACSDTNNVSGPPGPAIPGPLTVLTSSPLPDGTRQVSYDITLAPSGGTPPYTWSLAPGSPTLPNGLTLNQSNGNISGTPTAVGTTLTEFKLQDSKGQSVQKVLSIKVNVAPTLLTILTNSLTPGTINQFYAFALGGTGGTTPYTWGLKTGSSPLPSGIALDPSGVISGTPAVTSNATHIFTLTDATPQTVEKSLQLSINAIPLSITTPSPLPQGTANQNYSATLVATGGTGTHTWGLANGSPSLAAVGLTLTASTGVISGIPTGVSNQTYTFTATDQTLPTPQVATKTLQLVIGAAPPTLTITTPAGSSLPSGSVGSAYSTSLVATGGTGAHTWSIISGTLPNGLSLASSTGAITGTPQPGSNGTTPLTVQVQDSGTPQQTVPKALSITINLPAAPTITTPSLPAGTFNVAYNQTVSVTGGIGTLVWGVISGGLPPGLSLNTTNGNIFGTPTSTGSFTFTLRVTDSIPQHDDQILTITINPPAPPSITSPNSSSLPTGTVNQPYPNTQLTATGGAPPYSWSVNALQMPSGVGLDPNTGVISGTPQSGSNSNYNPTFTVTDSTFPTHLTAPRSYSLTINANVTPVTITTPSLSNGTVNDNTYSAQLAASGGTQPYNWSLNGGSSLPPGLNLSASGAITGTPTALGTTQTTFLVQDSTTPNQQSTTKQLSITINAAPQQLTITSTSPLPSGKVGDDYGTVTPAVPVTLTASGGTPPYTWSTTVTPPLPAGLSINATGTISGIPTASESNMSHTFTVTDSTNLSVNKDLSLTINP